jgi:hypothetical protein
MSMLADARSSLARLQKTDDARSGLQEAIALDGLRATLEPKRDSLTAAAARTIFLQTKGVQGQLVDDLGGLRKTVQTLIGQFEKAPTSATLKRGQRWVGLIASLEQLESSVTAEQQTSWRRDFDNHLFAGGRPSEVRARLALTPTNISALARYEQLFNVFAEYRKRVPQTDAEFEEVRRISVALEQVTFQEDVPSDVAAFFSAAASGGGASLGLLTPTVLGWLNANALLDRYVVRGRSV